MRKRKKPSWDGYKRWSNIVAMDTYSTQLLELQEIDIQFNLVSEKNKLYLLVHIIDKSEIVLASGYGWI